jgi:Sulfotransferase domain
MTLPNFLLIGANKAGTTSVYRYLAQHPEVYVSPMKEPNYFAPHIRRRDTWRHLPGTLEEYEALFDGVGREHAIGEASTAYLPDDEAPALVREALPEVRLVAILRNPLERAFSDYGMHRSWGDEELTFADAVASELDGSVPGLSWGRRYVEFGFYGRHLCRWLALFEREQLGIYLYDDLARDPEALLSGVAEFLGVSTSFSPETVERHNITRHPPRIRAVEQVAQWRPAKAAVKHVVPNRALTRLKEFVRRKNSVPPVFPPEIRQRLIELYRDDVAVVERIVDRDLSPWLR